MSLAALSALALAASSRQAWAQACTYPASPFTTAAVTVGPTTTPWGIPLGTTTFNVPKFNPSCGTLTAATVNLTAAATGDGSATNNALTNQNFTLRMRSSINVATPANPGNGGNQLTVNVLPSYSQAFTAVTPNSTVGFTNQTSNSGTTASGNVAAADLSIYSGTGNLVFSASGASSSGVIGGSNISATFAVQSQVSVTITYTYTPFPDMTIAKSHTGNFNIGQTGATYSITASNSGGGPTNGTTVTVTDTPPTGFTITAMAGTGWNCAVLPTCTRTDVLAAGASYPAITVTGNVATNAPTSMTNTATVSGGGETLTTNNTATDPTTVLYPDMTPGITHTGTLNPGTTGSYTVTVSNVGTGSTDGSTAITTTITLPAGVTGTATPTGTGWTCTGTGPYSCSRTSVTTPLAAAGAFPTIAVPVSVASNAGNSLTATAVVTNGSGGETNNANNSASDTVTNVPDLTPGITHTGTLNPGTTGSYTVTVSNVGVGSTDGTTAITTTITLPAGVTGTATPTGTGWTCTGAGPYSCSRAALTPVLAPAGAFPTISVPVSVASNAGNSLTATAVVTNGSGGETNNTNNSASDNVTNVADLTPGITHTGTLAPSTTGSYTVTVSNVGVGSTDGTTAITTTITLPAGVTGTATPTGTGWTCTGTGPYSCSRTALTPVLAPAGAFPTISVPVTVAANAANTLTATAVVTNGSGGETNNTNNSATDTVNNVPDLTPGITHTGTLAPSTTGTYNVTVSNVGAGSTDGTTAITVTVTLPTGITGTATPTGTGWTCTGAGPYSCSRTALAPVLAPAGVFPTIAVPVTVSALAVPPLTATAVITNGSGGETNFTNNTASDTVANSADMTPAITHTGSLNPGTTGSYTVTVSNVGNGSTDGTTAITTTITLPAGVTGTATPTGTGWTCTGAGPYSCSRTALTPVLAPAGAFPAISVPVSVASNAGNTLTATAVVTNGSGGEFNFTNNTASDTVTSNADMTPAITHTGSLNPGTTGSYTVTVSNVGIGSTDGLTAITTTITLPAGVTGTATPTGTGWTCTGAGPYTCSRDSLTPTLAPAGVLPAITVPVSVASNAGNTLTATAVVSNASGGETNNTNNSASDTVTNVPDMTPAITHTGTLAPSTTGTYNVTVSNVGVGSTNGTTAITVTVTLPAGITGTATPTGTGWTCTGAGPYSCSRTALTPVLAPAGAFPVISVPVTVSAGAGSPLTATAVVTNGSGGETNNANNSAADTVTSNADLTPAITHTGTLNPGTTGSYTVTVSNVGAGSTDGTTAITTTITLPAGVSGTATPTGTGWTCTGAGPYSCSRTALTPVLAPTAAFPAITVPVSVASNAGNSLTATAVVTNGSGGETNNANNSAADTVTNNADMTPAITHTGTLNPGTTGSYTVTVSNVGAGSTDGTTAITTTITLPVGVSGTATPTGTGWTCTGAGPYSCSRTALTPVLAPAGAFPAISVPVSVASNAGNTLTATAVVTNGSGGETNNANNSAADTVNNNADLTPAITHTGTLAPNTTGTYNVTVSNVGAGSTDGTTAITTTITLPAGITGTATPTGTGWTCTGAGPYTCSRTALTPVLAPAGAFPTISVPVTVSAGAGSPLTATAVVTNGSGGETNTANNSASDTVANAADLTPAITHTGSLNPGTTGSYTVTVSNVGPGATDGTTAITTTITLPTGVSGTATPTGTGWTCTGAGPYSCSRAALTPVLAAAAAFPAITVPVSVASNAGNTLTATAVVTNGSGGETNNTNNSASDTVTNNADMTPAITHTGTLNPGTTGSYTVTVSNVGAGSTDGTSAITATITLPPGITGNAVPTGTGWTCTGAGPYTCSRTSVTTPLAPAGAFPAITVLVSVASNAGNTLTANVVVTNGSGGETNNANNTASDTVNNNADLTPVITHTGPLTPSTTGTYNVTVSNVGAGSTDGTTPITTTINLPPGVSGTGVPTGTGWTCTGAGPYSCSRTSVTTPLTPGGSFPAISVPISVAPGAGSPLTATAVVTNGSGGETNTTNNSASDTVTNNADLTPAITHTGSLNPGTTGTYTVTVSNVGAGSTDGTTAITTTITLPAGVTGTGVPSGTGWTCTGAGPYSCSRTSVTTPLAPAGVFPAISVPVSVASTAGNSLTATAVVTNGSGGEINNTNNSASDTVTNNADMTPAITHTGTLNPGTTGSYTVTVSNVGIGSTDGTTAITTAINLPAGVTATAPPSGTGWTCTGAAPYSCTRTSVTTPLAPAGAFPPINVPVSVALNAGNSLTATAVVNNGSGGETNTANNTASDTVTNVSDMTVTITHPGLLAAGNNGSYTVGSSNVGSGSTNGTLITINIALPAGVTSSGVPSGAGWTCTTAPLACTRTDVLAPGSAFPNITVPVTVSPLANGTLTATATVTNGSGGETNFTNNSASDPFSTLPVPTNFPDLTVAKTHVGNFRQGQTDATYTIQVSNVGSAPSSGTVTVNDILPVGLTATAVTGSGWSCNLSGLLCQRSDALAVGASYPPITLVVTVANDAPASLINTAIVGGGGERNTGNNQSSDPTTVGSTPDLSITKSHSGEFRQGQTGATYSLVVSNVAPATAASSTGPVTVTDTLPAGLTATAISGAGWNCILGSLTCTRADALAPGASYPPITLTVDIATDAPAQVINTATVSGGGDQNPRNNTATDPATLRPLPDLTIFKSHLGTFILGQVGAQYVITVTNIGAGPTVGLVTIADSLPSGLTATAISGAGWNCALGSLTCTRADVLAPRASYPPITLTVDVSPDAPERFTNTVVVSGGGETNTKNNDASDEVLILPPDLTVTKSHSGQFTRGQLGAQFTITVSNVAPSPTVGSVTAIDALPAGLTATAISGPGWNCTLSPLACSRTDILQGRSSWPPITLTVDVARDAGPSLTNNVTVNGGADRTPGNNTGSDTVDIPQPDLSITKTHSGNFTRGQPGSYTVIVTNVGPGPTFGLVTVADSIPAGLILTGLSGAGWNCVPASASCSRSEILAPGAAWPPITVTVNVAPDAPANVTNTVTVSGGGDNTPANNTASDPTTLTAGPDLTISKTHTGNFTRGGNGVYTITVTNSGAAPSAGTATVTDNLPNGLIASAISGAGWTCTLTNLTCTRADALAPGAAWPPITITVTVAGNAPATLTNIGIVSGGGDINSGNNTASDPTNTTGNAPILTITKTHVGDFFRGGTGTYVITTSNVGTGPSVGAVSVADPLAPGITATDISGEGWTCVLDSLSCTRTDVLAPGASYPPVYIKVNVAPNAPPVIVNVATVRGGGSAPGTSGTGLPSSSDTVRLSVFDPGIKITKVSDRPFADTGQVLTYRIDVTNANPGKIFNTTINDQLPPGFQYIPNSARVVFTGQPSQPIDAGNVPGLLTFKLGDLDPGGAIVVTYRLLVTARAPNGDATNTARVGAAGPTGNPLISIVGGARVTVNASLLSSRQFVIGRIFEDLNQNGVMDKNEKPIAGVRVYLANGQSASTDSKGMYNIPSVNAGTVTIAIDPATIPRGYTLHDGGRYEGRSWTRLLRTPLGGGTMLRQNFGLVRLEQGQRGYVAPTAPQPPTVERASAPATPQPKLDIPLIATAIPDAMSVPGAMSLPAGVPSSLKVEITPAQPSAPADGRTGVNVRIRVTDAQGRTVPRDEIRIRTSLGQFVGTDRLTPMVPSIDALNRARREMGLATRQIEPEKPEQDPAPPSLFGIGTGGQNLEAQFGATTEQVSERLQVATVRLTNGEANVTLLAPNTSGTALLQAETGDLENRAQASSEIFFEPEKRSPIFVSMGEISVGRAAPEFALYGQDGQVSRRGDVFLRAPWGETLFTAAYTSHLPINNMGPNRGMFQLDPLDRVYPVFGDSSTQFRAAQANTRVYARAERGHSFALFGDLRGDQAKQNRFGLSDYNRNITGLQFHFEDQKKNFLELQGARPNTAFARDVFPASTLGLTQLSHIGLIPGSEMVTLEVRDRYNPEIVLSREPLLRSTDYNLDWSAGSLFFLRSISAFDPSLNLVQLVVTYEYRALGGESSVYGLKAQKIFEAAGLTFGFALTTQRSASSDPYYLAGVDINQKLARNGRLHLEIPVSYGSGLAAGYTSNTSTAAPAGGDVNGFGIRAEFSQPLPNQGRVEAAFSKTDTSFYNPFGATTLPGSQTARAALELAPASGSRAKLGFSDERNKSGLVDNSRQTVNLEWKQALDEAVGITFGYAYRNLDDTASRRSNQANMLSAALDVRLNARTSFNVRRDQNLTSMDPTYPNQTIIGARYRVNESVRLFATQRYSSAPIVPIGDYSRSGFAAVASKQEVSIGIEDRWNKYSSMQGRYLVENGLNGTDSFAVLGLVNRIPVAEHFSLDLGMERGTLITGRSGSFTSGSIGMSWLPNNKFRSSTRYEIRDRRGFGQIFTAGAAGRVHDGMTVLATIQHSDADFQPVPGVNNIYNARQSNVTQGTGAFAIRPLRHDSTAVMFSYTLRSADLTAPGATIADHDRVGILSTDGYWQPARPVEFFGKFAVSDRFYSFNGAQSISTRNFLWQGRAQVKLISRLDAAIEGRIFDQPYAKITRSSAGAELGIWALRDLRAGVGYNFKSAEEIQANFLTGRLNKGFYFVLSTKLSKLFDLFSYPEQKENKK